MIAKAYICKFSKQSSCCLVVSPRNDDDVLKTLFELNGKFDLSHKSGSSFGKTEKVVGDSPLSICSSDPSRFLLNSAFLCILRFSDFFLFRLKCSYHIVVAQSSKGDHPAIPRTSCVKRLRLQIRLSFVQLLNYLSPKIF